MIKLSDYVMDFIANKGIRTVFMLPGGGSMHLVDSLGRNTTLDYVCCLHEQAVAIAAEAYGQHTNDIGVGLVTTGPGGTNTITGVAAAWIDSTPCMFISGQVKRADLLNDSGVRQMGPQEVDIVSIVKSITKYAATVLEPMKIRYQLEEAYYLALCGRKGPVWLDIPLDVQAAMIEEEKLEGFTPVREDNTTNILDSALRMIDLINSSKRPVMLVGNGVKLAGAEDLLLEFADMAKIPILLTWKVIDLMSYDHPLNFGSPGILGQRSANYILQNSDLLIILGSRLDSSLTGYNHPNFAPKAYKVMVDIDKTEINKMQMEIKLPVVGDINPFLLEVCSVKDRLTKKDRNDWLSYCTKMKEKYPVALPEYYNDKEFVNSYVFVETLCNILKSDDIIVPESSGSAGEITYQAFKVKKGQKIKNAAGLGAMGFGLPYAIGACLANNRKRTILINGDGAFQLNIQELETVVSHKLPIKIFIWNNSGYASIMATQRNYFDCKYVASNRESKLFLPNILAIASAYGFKTIEIRNHQGMAEKIKQVLDFEGPVLCEVFVSPMQVVKPKVQSIKLPNGSMASNRLEEMWPYLSEAEIQENTLE